MVLIRMRYSTMRSLWLVPAFVINFHYDGTVVLPKRMWARSLLLSFNKPSGGGSTLDKGRDGNTRRSTVYMGRVRECEFQKNVRRLLADCVAVAPITHLPRTEPPPRQRASRTFPHGGGDLDMKSCPYHERRWLSFGAHHRHLVSINTGNDLDTSRIR